MTKLLFLLRPADSLTMGFSGLLLFLTVFFFERIPSAGNLAIIYASLMLFQLLLVFLHKINDFLGLVYDIIFPVVGVIIIFDSLEMLVHAINPNDIDYLLIRFDYFLFGTHPTVFMEKWMYPLLTDIVQTAYSTYYFIPVAVGAVIRLKGKRQAFEKTLFFLLLCFYLSYVGYLIFPALGPRYAMEHLHESEIRGFLVAESIQKILNILEGVKRDAFPSGHTGIALTALYLAYRYERVLFWILLLPVLLLIVATVYCRYHYIVDVIGGIFLTVVTIGLGKVYYKFWISRYDVRSAE